MQTSGRVRKKNSVTEREYPEKPLVGVGGVVLHKKSVLLVRRARAPLKGEWSLPGGLVEVGESLSAAVRREIREETGLAVRVGGVLKVLNRITRDKRRRVRYHYVLIDFLCTPESGAAHLGASSDASEAKWVKRAELAKCQLRAATLRVIERAFKVQQA